jgi:hypothetical protein
MAAPPTGSAGSPSRPAPVQRAGQARGSRRAADRRPSPRRSTPAGTGRGWTAGPAPAHPHRCRPGRSPRSGRSRAAARGGQTGRGVLAARRLRRSVAAGLRGAGVAAHRGSRRRLLPGSGGPGVRDAVRRQLDVRRGGAGGGGAVGCCRPGWCRWGRRPGRCRPPTTRRPGRAPHTLSCTAQQRLGASWVSVARPGPVNTFTLRWFSAPVTPAPVQQAATTAGRVVVATDVYSTRPAIPRRTKDTVSDAMPLSLSDQTGSAR